MNSEQIRLFVRAGNTLNFTKTAEELFISQSAVSKRISSLEQELGIVLFDRHKRTLALTPAGAAFLDFFQNTSAEFQKLCLRFGGTIESSDKQLLRIGINHGWPVNLFSPLFSAFYRENPSYEIVFSTCTYSNGFDNLISGEIELLFTNILPNESLTQKYGNNLVKLDLLKANKLFLYSATHPLAGKLDVRPDEFKPYTLLTPNMPIAPISQEGRNVFKKEFGFVPRVKIIEDTETILYTLLNSTDYAVFDVLYRLKDMAGLSYTTWPVSNNLYAFYLKPCKSKAISAFLNSCEHNQLLPLSVDTSNTD